MAISIKNHEDRITALENKGEENPSSACEIIFNGNSGTANLTKSITDFQMLCFVVQTDENRGYVDITVNTSSFINLGWAKICNRAGGGRPANVYDTQVTRVSNTQLTCNKGMIKVYGINLKLYYNFSYNITREFYKVKFKLRHYLCSHLQNYASNKGGVIQNGY